MHSVVKSSFSNVLSVLVALTIILSGSNVNAQTLNKWCKSDNSICVQSYYITRTQAVTFCVSSTATGWVGTGLGTGMSGADIWVGWNNNGNTFVSDRTGTGHTMPTVDATTTLLVSSNNSTISSVFETISGHNTRVLFSRFIYAKSNVTKEIIANQTNSFIFSYSNTAPTNPNNASSSFTKHDVYGTFSLDVTASSSSNSSSGSGSGSSSSATASTSSAAGFSTHIAFTGSLFSIVSTFMVLFAAAALL